MEQIKYRKGYKYQLSVTYKVQTNIFLSYSIKTDWLELDKYGFLTIQKGYAWDGPSGPTLDTLDSMRGSLVHDALYQLMRLGLLPEKYRHAADHLLLKILLEDGMNPIRARLWHEAVVNFAVNSAKFGTEREIITAPIICKPVLTMTMV